MRRLLVIATALAAGCVNNDDVPPPHIAAVLPDHAAGGAIVELDGMDFCQMPATGSGDEVAVCDQGSVNFGEQHGTVSAWTDTQIMVEVPTGPAGAISVTVTANGRASNGITFTRSD